jgi:hypothetical protein
MRSTDIDYAMIIDADDLVVFDASFDPRVFKTQMAKEITDDLLRAVLGAGVDDEDVIDQRKGARQAAADELSLVFDDHAQPDGLGASPWQFRCLLPGQRRIVLGRAQQ